MFGVFERTNMRDQGRLKIASMEAASSGCSHQHRAARLGIQAQHYNDQYYSKVN